MTNLKAVIPVAGLGMHMLPATKAIPKEMLPIVDKPMIQYIVDEIVAAGIKEILLVTHASKNAVENHFDTSYELESLLELRVKRQLLAEVQSICPPGVTIMNVRQGEPLGLGHSILCARRGTARRCDRQCQRRPATLQPCCHDCTFQRNGPQPGAGKTYAG